MGIITPTKIGVVTRFNSIVPRIDVGFNITNNITMHCTVLNCKSYTLHGKLWCVNHVSHSPYVQDLHNRIDCHTEYLKRVVKFGTKSVSIDSHLTIDIIVCLWLDWVDNSGGVFSGGKIAKLINAKPKHVKIHIDFLCDKKICESVEVVKKRNRRKDKKFQWFKIVDDLQDCLIYELIEKARELANA